LIVGVLISLTGAGVFISIIAYRGQTAHKRTRSNGAANANTNVVTIDAYLLSVSPDTDSARFRLVFGYWGQDQGYASSDLPSSVTGLSVLVLGIVPDPSASPSTTANLYQFEPGKEMGAVDVTMNFALNDTSLRYPFDRYEGYLAFKVTDSHNDVSPQITLTNTTDEWVTSQDENLCDIANADWYTFSNVGPGGPDLNSSCSPSSSVTQLQNFGGDEITIHRTGTLQFYALFILGLMWALAAAGVVMALTLMQDKNHKIEAGPLTYLAALLFAFPLIRSLLPGSPGLGILADFAGYFWVEAVVGVTLLALLVTWIVRERRRMKIGQQQPLAEDEMTGVQAIDDSAEKEMTGAGAFDDS
jgi:hypothetical protein